MPLIQTDEKSIFFSHVPKAGGSSVEDYLIRRFDAPLGLRDAPHRRHRRWRGLLSPVTHLSVKDLEDVLPQKLDFSFAVVRNPLARMMSEYRFQGGVSQLSRFNFSTWLRIILRCAKIDPRVYDNHIRPQSDLVSEDMEVFRLEDGFKNMIARLDAVTETTAPDVAVGHLLKKDRKPIKVRRDDVRLIENYYAVDYERFGYEREGLSGYEPDALAPLREFVAHAIAPVIVHRQRRDWLR